MSDENDPSHTPSHQKRPGALQLGPRKKPYVTVYTSVLYPVLILYVSCSGGTDPLVHHGRHFGRTVHALCSVSALLNNGILRMGELADQPEDSFTHECAFLCSILRSSH
jgi:hypothetical protein